MPDKGDSYSNGSAVVGWVSEIGLGGLGGMYAPFNVLPSLFGCLGWSTCVVFALFVILSRVIS